MPESHEHIERLDQRCRYLTERIKAKQTVGWEFQYDQSERDALAWALGRLARLGTVEAAIASLSEPAACSPAPPAVASRPARVRSKRTGPSIQATMLDALKDQPLSPGDLARRLGHTVEVSRYHVKQLEARGLVHSAGPHNRRLVALSSNGTAKEAP